MSSPEAGLTPTILAGTGFWEEPAIIEALITKRLTPAEDDVHCNTAEGEWSIPGPWWRGFRGVAKRHAYRYLSEYSFRRSHREETPQK